ncbi:MAG: LysM peptidoglycan-binding domain-containing protein [Chloroflexi bacterium]|nr:MAG: LysM peptidoglycan-binding domain-containing protein [Chloroflexota bacterium]
MRRLIIILLVLATMLLLGATVLAQNNTVYVVQRGDNLFRISLRFNTSMSAIAAANNISNINLIFAGQRLVIPGTSGGQQPAPAPPPQNPPPQAPPAEATTYTVVRGDTLGSIARRFGTTIQAIASANGIANPNLIFPGQVLTISGSTVPAPAPGPAPAPPPSSGGGFELGGQVASFSFPDQMRGAGMTWAKSQVIYNQGDPPSIAQGAIDAARLRNFKILLSIKGNPAQIAANPAQYYQDFANFLGGVAQLGPDAIEVWNEQNIEREWPVGLINGAQYTQMLSAAFQAIKAVNPNVLVISGAPAPTGFFGGTCQPNGCDDNVYLQQMAQAGAAQFADCIGIHYNEGILPPSARTGDPRGNSTHYTRYFGTMMDVYSGAFPGKQLCFTELGYLTGEGLGPLPPAFAWASNVTVQNQAEWLAQAVTLARNSGRVRLLIVWNVDFTNFGADPQAGYAIIRPDNTCRACITLGAAMGVS